MKNSTALLLLLLLAAFSATYELDQQSSSSAPPHPSLHTAGRTVVCELDGSTVVCNGTSYTAEDEDTFPTPRFWADLGVSAALVCLAGLMSGLTMGLMSIDFLNLQILANGGGTKQEQIYGTSSFCLR
jgi:hypothetical protein